MARKLSATEQARVAGADAGADDLAVLHPERVLRIAGDTVTVREYGFVEGLRLAAAAAPVVAALAEHAQRGALAIESLQHVMAAHADDVVVLIAAACDRSTDWVRALGDADGLTLAITWMTVNAGFFGRRVVMAAQLAAARAPAGATSTPPSSPTGTTPPGSEPTPPAS